MSQKRVIKTKMNMQVAFIGYDTLVYEKVE